MKRLSRLLQGVLTPKDCFLAGCCLRSTTCSMEGLLAHSSGSPASSKSVVTRHSSNRLSLHSGTHPTPTWDGLQAPQGENYSRSPQGRGQQREMYVDEVDIPPNIERIALHVVKKGEIDRLTSGQSGLKSIAYTLIIVSGYCLFTR